MAYNYKRVIVEYLDYSLHPKCNVIFGNEKMKSYIPFQQCLIMHYYYSLIITKIVLLWERFWHIS